MPIADLVLGRLSIMILSSLFTEPFNAVVWYAFDCQAKRLEGAGTRTCMSSLAGIAGWVMAAFQLAICGVVIIYLTAAKMSDEGTAKVPCNCRISHNEQQSEKWLFLIGCSILFSLFVSRPISIGLVTLATECGRKGRLTANELRNAIANRRSTSRGGAQVETEMVAVSNGRPGGGGGLDDSGVIVTIERSKSNNIEEVQDVRPFGEAPISTFPGLGNEGGGGNGGDGGVGGLGGGGLDVRTTTRRVGVKPSIQRLSRRYGTSAGKKQGKGKKKVFDVEPSNVVQGRTSRRPTSTATSTTATIPVAHPKATLGALTPRPQTESKSVSASGVGNEGKQVDDATCMAQQLQLKSGSEGTDGRMSRGNRTSSVEL